LSVLNSGSNANATVVVEDGHALVIDCGLSAREFLKRLEDAFGEVEIDGILITHEHSDHIGGIRVLQNRIGSKVHATRLTVFRNDEDEAIGKRRELLRSVDLNIIPKLEQFEIGPFSVTAIPLWHDAGEPVGYFIESGGKSLTIASDLGRVDDELRDFLSRSDAVILSSNHDVQLLEGSRYPPHLIARIRGPFGHLSNEDSAEAITEASPKVAFLAHISKDANTPQRAEFTTISAVEEKELDVEVLVTHRDKATKPIEVP